MTHLIDFYTNKSPSAEGIYLKDMWDFNDWQFENTHRFIQWMFPIDYQSKHCPHAPVATGNDIYDAALNEEFKKNLLKSLYIIEDFWGFDVIHDGCTERSPTFRNFHLQDWICQHNHHFLRIPRVLHSLVVFGLEKEAEELMHYLETEVYPPNAHNIGEETLNYWKSAMCNTMLKKVAWQ